ALIHLIFLYVQTCFTFRTVKHNRLPFRRLGFYDCPLLYLVSSTAQVKWRSLAAGASDVGSQFKAARVGEENRGAIEFVVFPPGRAGRLRARRICVAALLALFSTLLSAHDAPAYVDPQIKAALNEISAAQVQS